MIGPGLPLDLNLPLPRSTSAAPPMLSQVVLGGLGMVLLLSAGVAWWRSRPLAPSGAPETDPGP